MVLLLFAGSPSPPILLLIRSRLNLNNSFHASFWDICLTAFFGLFRKSHLLPDSATAFNPKRCLTRADFTPSAFGFLVQVRSSKTIQFGQRILTIPLVSCPGSPLCPVQAIRHAFSFTLQASPTTQAFCFHASINHTGSILTYKSFMTCLHKVLQEVGLPASSFGSHSFRRGGGGGGCGGATYALLQAGVPLDVISVMGDWKSDAVFLYLHMPLSQRLAAQRTIASTLCP